MKRNLWNSLAIASCMAVATSLAAAPAPTATPPAALEKAARAGDEKALKQLIEYFINRGDEKTALYWVNEAVERDLPDALLLRSMQLQGTDHEESIVFARRALKAAQTRAERGDPYYQLMVGCLYQSGAKGAFLANEKEALRWIRMAAAQNYPPARAALSELAPPRFDREQEAALLKEDAERAQQFIARHPDITGGDGRSEETAFTIRLVWPDCNPLIENLIAHVYPGAHPTCSRSSSAGGNRTVRRQSLVDRNGRSIEVYFNYPDRPNPYRNK